MKIAVLSVLLILAGAFASPPQLAENRDIVTDFIRDLIVRVGQFIKDSGYDPVEIPAFKYEYSGTALQFQVNIENLNFSGASNIIINRLFNNVLLSTFAFDVVLPELNLSIGDSGLTFVYGETDLSGQLKGSLSIKNIRLVGEVSYEGNIVVGVKIVGINLQNSIDSFESDVTVIGNGNDHSERVNNFINVTLPNTLEQYKNQINAVIAQIILALVNRA